MPYPDATEFALIQEQADNLLRLHNQSAPRAMDGENLVSYKRRLASKVQQVTPNLKDINLNDARGSAFDLLQKQIYDEARREAIRPTTIPKGEMREMRKFDDTGRPFYEWQGSPKAWLGDFSNGAKRKLAGIRTESQRGYIPSR
jgi:hypothetical protein